MKCRAFAYRKTIGLMSIVCILLMISVVLLRKNYGLRHLFQNTPSPDSYVKNFTYSVYDQKGRLVCLIRGPILNYFNQTNTAILTQPKITLFLKNGAHWYINAHHGKSLENNKQILLWGNVVITKQSKPPIVINTAAMTIYPNQSQAQSLHKTTINQGKSHTTGTGFTANFKTGDLTLFNHVTSHYVPQTR